MSSISSIAVSGINAAQFGLSVSAHNLANLSTAGYTRRQTVLSERSGGGVEASVAGAATTGDAPEIDVVGQLLARNAFLANLSVFKAADRMTGSLLDTVTG